MRQVLENIEAGQVQAEMAEQSGAFDRLADEPDLYTVADIKKSGFGADALQMYDRHHGEGDARYAGTNHSNGARRRIAGGNQGRTARPPAAGNSPPHDG